MNARIKHKVCINIVSAILFIYFSILFSGCFDIPDAINSSQEIDSINIYVQQKDILDSSILKINPNDSAILKTNIFPRQYKKELTFEWIHKNNQNKLTVLGNKDEFIIPPSANFSKIPNLLKISDKMGNIQSIDFKVTINTKPIFNKIISPLPEDTLYGNSQTAFLFKWDAFDRDSYLGDNLNFTIVIDEKKINTGEINSILQSGLKPGKHTFYVVVRDTYGDFDLSALQVFFVIDTLGEIP